MTKTHFEEKIKDDERWERKKQKEKNDNKEQQNYNK
jgi:hypothetical protein